MKLKIFLIILILASVFCIAGRVSAMTELERQLLVAQLKLQIIMLQTQLAQILAQQQQYEWCHTFNTNLNFDNSGSGEVFNLHIALQRQAISYYPDDVNTYSTGTYQGVAQFQLKYGLSATGYVDSATRDKLNLLYKCAVPPVITCKPNWQCGEWSLCMAGQQGRTCTDSSSCGVTTNKPAEIQSCTQKPGIRIQANGSDSPVNIFLALGSGASVSSSGEITLTQPINLAWSGVGVSSCTTSDSLGSSATIFSGYKPSSGYQTVTLSGKIQGTSATANKISDTFKITCISTATGSSVSDSTTVNLFYTVSGICNPYWSCTNWTTCTSSRQTRTCTDYNGCLSLAGKPAESQSCTVPPAVNIKANNSEGPITVSNGSSVSLLWSSSRADSCQASGQWSGAKAASGNESATITASPEIFTITCTNAGGTATDSVTVYTTEGGVG